MSQQSIYRLSMSQQSVYRKSFIGKRDVFIGMDYVQVGR